MYDYDYLQANLSGPHQGAVGREFVAPQLGAETASDRTPDQHRANGGTVLHHVNVPAPTYREQAGYGPSSPAGRQVLGRDPEY